MLLVCAVPSAAAGLTLVENGRSGYAIVTAPNSPQPERHAAQELQSFLEQMSGAKLPIVTEARPRMILVGASPALEKLNPGIRFADLGSEGFALKTAGRHLIIAGGQPRGSLYGVYTLLEKLGCRWFTPEVSRIPKRRTIAIGPLNESQKPAFEYREPFFSEALDRDWAARNKTNGAHQRLDVTVGGNIQYYPFVHSFDLLIPPDHYFGQHPEYFSLIDGQRRAQGGQLCLTNPDVLRTGVEAVERWITEHPEATIISVSQNDRFGWCECDNCRRVEREEGGVHSGPLLRYVNALAEQIEKRHPDKLIDTLAYQYTEDPPAVTRPRRNVRVRLCPIDACEAHAYEQCPYDAYFLKNLRAWGKITDRLYVWHYNTNFAHYLLPFPDFDELAADLALYKRNGVAGVFLEGSVSGGGGAENAGLRSYVMAKLLWDPKADVNRLVDEFLGGYYGRAAQPMRAYFDLMQRQVRAGGRHIWIYDSPGAPYLNAAFLADARELFRQAEAAAESDAVRARVRQARLGINYVELTRAKKFKVEGDQYRPADLSGLKERWSAFLAVLRQFGITNISESSLATKDDENFQRYVRPYSVTALENAQLRVHIVPGLEGRVTDIIDKRTGRNLLEEPDPAAKQYPDLGGLRVQLYTDYVTRMPGSVTWTLDAGATATEARLTGVCQNGLRLKRRLWLQGAELRTETVLENATAGPVAAAVQSQWDADPGDVTAAVVRFQRQDGVAVERPLIQPEKIPAGSETYSGSAQPDGEWRVSSRQGGPALEMRFPKEQAGRCFLSWTAKNENRVSMAVWSVTRKLQPGERITLDADYGVEER